MNYTNRHNLDEHITRWLAADEYDYDPSVISATTLISPARAWALKKRFADKLTIDYSDMIAIRYGTAIHDSLEKASAYGSNIVEKRFYAEHTGFRISGKMDAIVNGVICDNKSCSVWRIIHKDFEEYIKQLSIYKWLLHKNGIQTADHGVIYFFFTDWKKSDAAKGGDYPPIRIQKQEIPLWSLEETETYISERLEEFAFALMHLPRCTQEELWQTETTYAYYQKPGAAKATKVFSSFDEANEYAALKGGVAVVRPGKAKRCGYCAAAPFCDQYNELREAGLIDE